jgi:SNARE protein
MSEELDDYDQDLAALEEEIRKGTKALAKLKGEKREEKVKFLQGRIKHMRVIHRTYKVELRELSKEDKKPYEQKYHEHEETITRLVQDLDWAKADGDRQELGTNGTADGATPGGKPSRDQVLDKAERLQKEDLHAVERMKGKVADAQEIGAATNEKLHAQTQQIAGTIETLDEQKVLLEVGSQQLKAFTRRIATDKIIIGFICLVVILVVVLIALNAFAPKQLEGAVKIPSAFDLPPNVQTAIQSITLTLPNFLGQSMQSVAATAASAAAPATTTVMMAAEPTTAM